MSRSSLKALALAASLAAGWRAGLSADTLRYDGELFERGVPASGLYDFRFRLFAGPEGDLSDAIGDPVELDAVPVEAGRFAVALDFGTEIAVKSAWLAIEVALDGVNEFAVLGPLQQVDLSAPDVPDDNFPAGTIVYFDLAACPSGWSDYSAAQGRTLVGLLPGGTLAGAQGDPLTDLELRRHTHQFSAGGTSTASGGHNHKWAHVDPTDGVQWWSFDSAGASKLVFGWTNGVGNEGSGIYPLAANPTADFFTDMRGDHTHYVSFGQTTTSLGGSPLPYLQLRVCRKN